MTVEECILRKRTAQFVIFQEPVFWWYVDGIRLPNGDIRYVDVIQNHTICNHSLMFASYPQLYHLFANDGTMTTELNRNFIPINRRKKRK